MVGKDIDPSDIGKHPKIIKAAQYDLTQTDVLVCGKCHNVFHFIELFKEHKDEGCERETGLQECRETKPKAWAFLLWKASQLSNNDASQSPNSWKLYQTWINMDESVRETWVVAGKTIQSFARMGQGNLQEMPVKITKTVVDNIPKTAPVPPNRVINRVNDSRVIKKEEEDDSPPKSDAIKVVRKTVGTPITQPNKAPISSASINKSINRRASRTIPNTSGQEFEEETVEKIIAKRFNPRRKMHEYLVKWEGFPHDQNTWEPQLHLQCCPQLLDTFEKQLARQKEQRAKQAAAVQQQQHHQQQQQVKQEVQQESQTNSATPNSPGGRPARNSKAKALDQVKQWCAEEETNSSNGTKRKMDDSDYEDNPAGEDDEDFEDDNIPAHTVKRLKNGSAVSVKVDSKMDVKITQVPTIIKAVNGSLRNALNNDSSAEIVITKDSSQGSGIVKKAGFTNSSHKTEAQIRVLSKGENTTSGIVRLAVPQLSGVQKATTATPTTTTSVTSTTPRITQITQKSSQVGTPTATTVGQAQISQVQTHRILNPKESMANKSTQQNPVFRTVSTTKSFSTSGTRSIQSQPKTTVVQRTILSPASSTNQTPTSGKMIINRGVKNVPTPKTVTPEQKIIQLSKSGDLKVTRKVITHSPQQQQQQQGISRPVTVIKSEEPETLGSDEFSETQNSPRQLTLCPVTGKVITQSEQEPTSTETTIKKEPDVSTPPQPQSGIFHAQPPRAMEQAQEELAGSLALATDDEQTQQILATEDGTPLLVTGEDGTIYQVAGKNAEGQTILIAQGADGEQQFAYVAAEDGEEGVLAIDNAVAEAVAQMLPEQQEALAAAAAASGGEAQFIIKQDDGSETIATGDGTADTTQALTIQTGDTDSQDANIPAEVVQADLPSPGGTRRVVLLLQDGTFMMTEMHDDEYQALNIVP